MVCILLYEEQRGQWADIFIFVKSSVNNKINHMCIVAPSVGMTGVSEYSLKHNLK